MKSKQTPTARAPHVQPIDVNKITAGHLQESEPSIELTPKTEVTSGPLITVDADATVFGFPPETEVTPPFPPVTAEDDALYCARGLVDSIYEILAVTQPEGSVAIGNLRGLPRDAAAIAKALVEREDYNYRMSRKA